MLVSGFAHTAPAFGHRFSSRSYHTGIMAAFRRAAAAAFAAILPVQAVAATKGPEYVYYGL